MTLSEMDKSFESDFLMFPNPSNGDVNFKVEGDLAHQLMVTDINGVVVLSREINLQQTLDLRDLPRGIYTVRIGDSKYSHKLILE
jgi:hypothetical protein